MPLLPTLHDPRFNSPTDEPVPEMVRQAPWYWSLSVIAAAAIAIRLRVAGAMEPGDDAYITLRHVKNILEGHGYVFNLGEPMLGTTTVLYPLLLTFLCLITGLDPIQGGAVLAIGCELFNFPLLLFVATRISQSYGIGAFVCLAYAFSNYAAIGAMGYMEAPLFVMMILSTVSLALLPETPRSRAILALFAAFTVLCRPEGVLVVALLFGSWLLNDRRLPVREIAIFLIPIVPWLIFAFAYFGSPIPQSVHAKRIAYFSYPFQAATEIRYHFSTLLAYAMPDGKTPNWVGLLLGGPLWIFGTFIILQRKALAGTLLFGFNILFVLAYFLANPFVFLWYLIPLEPAYLIGIAVGAKQVAQKIAGGSDSEHLRTQRFVLGAAATAFLLLLPMRYGFYSQIADILHPSGAPATRAPLLSMPHSFPGTIAGLRLEREGWYKLVADDLAPFVNEKTTILASEFGATAYYSSARLVSSVGHVSPEVVKYLPPKMEETDYPAINHSIPVSMVQGLKPDYVVSLEIYIRKSLLKDSWFKDNYRLWKKYPAHTFGSDGLYVFARNDLPANATPLQASPHDASPEAAVSPAPVASPAPSPSAAPAPSPQPSAAPLARKGSSKGTARWSESTKSRPQQRPQAQRGTANKGRKTSK